MITLHLPKSHYNKMRDELARAGRKEIGGILMGEQLQPGLFKVSDVTYQRSGGTVATFIRNTHLALKALKKFFYRTNGDYGRFNYLGEWHSHPSYAAWPSSKDHNTMFEMIESPDMLANFLVLLVVKINSHDIFEATITTYLPNGVCCEGVLILDD